MNLIKNDDSLATLNEKYRSLIQRANEIRASLTRLHGGFRTSIGFFNGHVIKNEDGIFREDAYPIPVISVDGICDIEVDFRGLRITTKMNKARRNVLVENNIRCRFEVYGVQNYLAEYGDSKNIDALVEAIEADPEEEYFITFYPDENVDSKEILRFIRMIQRHGFYY